jgi:hypothetical protein
MAPKIFEFVEDAGTSGIIPGIGAVILVVLQKLFKGIE